MPPPFGRLALAVLAAAAAACASAITTPLELAYDVSPPGLMLSSQPPGAEVWLDESFSGFSTPCVMAVDRSERHTVELRLPGYAVAKRRIVPHKRYEVIPWSDGDLGNFHWRFPIFLPLGPFFVPVKYDGSTWPARIHVRMRLLTEE